MVRVTMDYQWFRCKKSPSKAHHITSEAWGVLMLKNAANRVIRESSG